MTLSGRLTGLFPMVHLLLLAACLWAFLLRPGVLWAVTFLNLLYLVPPLLWQVYRAVYGQNKRIWIINRPQRCDWWVAHQLQMTYAVFPALEAMLRVIPGAYSAWLRLWGSHVGRGIYWTPNVELVDRHNLTLGDRIVFGHRIIMTGHAIVRKANGMMVLIDKGVTVGDDCFLGACSRYGMGVAVPAGTQVPYDAQMIPRRPHG